MRAKNKLVCGVGINDADYEVQLIVKGQKIVCQFYQIWRGALTRSYDKKYHAKKPTYVNCTVCEEWLTFSNFRAWMQCQDWRDKYLDKDLLIPGNKVYSPDACSFVDIITNSFVTDSAAKRGIWPIGVNLDNTSGKFMSRCCNPFTGKREYLGRFFCYIEAHNVWKNRKHELALQLADLQTDERVANALRLRYAG